MGIKVHLEDLARRGRTMCNVPSEWNPTIAVDPDACTCRFWLNLLHLGANNNMRASLTPQGPKQ